MSRAETLLLLEQEVGVLIRRVRRVIAERSRAIHPDLQPASYLLLSYVAHRGPMRSSEVAEKFGIDKGAISRQTAHLLELGLLDRVTDPVDGRAMLISASAEAAKRLEEVASQRRKRLDEHLSDWSEAELEAFVSHLARYNASLD